jgi:uncharacterized protein YndB with AHSA1/START domain
MPEATEPLRHLVRIAAPPDVVFPYFTDPERMTSWMGIAAMLDPRPGGQFRVQPNSRDIVLGEYLEVDPPQRVVFTWGFDTRGASRVEVTLEPDGEGTLLTLDHHGLAGESRSAHEAGWSHYLGRLTQAAAGTPPGPDPWSK